jgi:hypothetical protein
VDTQPNVFALQVPCRFPGCDICRKTSTFGDEVVEPFRDAKYSLVILVALLAIATALRSYLTQCVY